jgi:hypothetical protein
MVIKISLGKYAACSKGKLLSGRLCSLVLSETIAPLFIGETCVEPVFDWWKTWFLTFWSESSNANAHQAVIH